MNKFTAAVAASILSGSVLADAHFDAGSGVTVVLSDSHDSSLQTTTTKRCKVLHNFFVPMFSAYGGSRDERIWVEIDDGGIRSIQSYMMVSDGESYSFFVMDDDRELLHELYQGTVLYAYLTIAGVKELVESYELEGYKSSAMKSLKECDE